MFVIVIWSQYRPQWGMWQQFSVYLCATAETHDNLKWILCTPILQSAPSPSSFLLYVPYFLHSRVSIEGNATERVNWLGRWQWWGQQQYIYLDQLLIQGSHQLECSEISLVIFQSKSTALTNNSGFQVHENSPWHMFPSSSFAEKGIKRIISPSNGFVARHLSIRLDPMFQTVQLPAGIANLYTSLANVDRNALTLGGKKTDPPLRRKLQQSISRNGWHTHLRSWAL